MVKQQQPHQTSLNDLHTANNNSKWYSARFSLKVLLPILILFNGALNFFSYRQHVVLLDTKDTPNNLHSSLSEAQVVSKNTIFSIQQQQQKQQENVCTAEYQRVMVNQGATPGLTQEDFRRSRAWVGNEQRLANIARKLQNRSKPVNAVVCGGSISIGHGVEPQFGRYSHRLEEWLNELYPLNLHHRIETKKTNHKVFNRGSHGADICAMAKRLDIVFDKIYNVNAYGSVQTYPDLVILEFGVNDYQGQDHKRGTFDHTDLFFGGFQEKALCAEAVVYRLLQKYPNTAIAFLEFQTAILPRKTAQLLHMGVAHHYQIPVISYAEVVMPSYYQLIQTLKPHNYTRPLNDTVLPYPHGCAPRCRVEDLTLQFQPNGCLHLCTHVAFSGLADLESCKVIRKSPPKGRDSCYPVCWAHDHVHPSKVGHNIAKDLIAHAIASVQYGLCQHKNVQPAKHVLPSQTYFLASSSTQLVALSDFIFVKDTMSVFGENVPLVSSNHSKGFLLSEDGIWNKRMGWISETVKGGEFAEFHTDKEHLPVGCYILYLAFLKSYEGMGTFTVRVYDKVTFKSFEIDLDGIWEPRISVPVDIALLPKSKELACTGNCVVTILTHPQPFNRTGQSNKVKIVTFSARMCRDEDFDT